ncbi:hypothetical protein V496_00616 [Pseudogymnoascus sp. VKM F-4515 (FW-2607)]|nr:hypothetical protein V496_00616 [Pseudogymnoascus sp. VKM F-4515 (FW-2607)]
MTPTFTPPRLARYGAGMAAETMMAATPSLGLEHEVDNDAKDACHLAMSSSASSHSVEKEHKLVAEGLFTPSAQETDVDSVNGSDRNEKLEEAGAAVAKVDTKKDVEGDFEMSIEFDGITRNELFS